MHRLKPVGDDVSAWTSPGPDEDLRCKFQEDNVELSSPMHVDLDSPESMIKSGDMHMICHSGAMYMVMHCMIDHA